MENPCEHISDVKTLTNDFYNAGFVTREKDQYLNNEFKRLKGLFYEEVKRYKNERARESIERYYKNIERKEEYIRNLESRNSEIRFEIDYLDPDSNYYYENKERYEGWIDSNDEKISDHREDIRNYNDKIFNLKCKIE